MIQPSDLYTGVSRAAWGYFFLYIDINLGRISILPAFVGFLLFLSSIRLLEGERRDLALLRPLGQLLAVWYLGAWLATWVGIKLDNQLPFLSLIFDVASLYFHFQLFTDFAALAQRYQGPEDTLDRRLLRWRTLHILLITATSLSWYPAQWGANWWYYVVIALAVAGLFTCLCLMAALFALRRLFRPESNALS